MIVEEIFEKVHRCLDGHPQLTKDRVQEQNLICKSLKRYEQLQFTDRQPETTHHIRVVRGSDSLVVKVVPVDWREKGVVLYF